MSPSDAGLPEEPAGGSGEPVESDVDTVIGLLDRLATLLRQHNQHALNDYLHHLDSRPAEAGGSAGQS